MAMPGNDHDNIHQLIILQKSILLYDDSTPQWMNDLPASR